MAPLGGGFIDFVFPGFRTHAYDADPQRALQWNVVLPASDSFTGVTACMFTGARRPAVGPLLSPRMLADRFNIFGHTQLRQMGDIAEGVHATFRAS